MYHLSMMNLSNTLCRVCLNEGDINIFDRSTSSSISHQIMACVCLEFQICPNDGFPQKICKTCISQLDIAYKFHIKCLASEKEFIKMSPAKQKDLNNKSAFKLNSQNDEFEFDQDNDSDKSLNKESESDKNPEEINLHSAIISQSQYKSECNKSISREMDDRQSENKKDSKMSFLCTLCGKLFTQGTSLRAHQRIHSGERPFHCSQCNKSFLQPGHLTSHIRTHTGEKPFKCRVCSSAFSVAHSLTKHLRTHSGERPYKCMTCSKTFVASYHLSNHRKRHLGQKDFSCDWPHCDYKFVNLSEMKRHRKKHTNKITSRAKTKLK